MDKQTRMEIAQVVNEAIRDALEESDERWLSGHELCAKFQMFNEDFLKRYGKVLPRARASVTDKNGKTRFTGWAYPERKISRMIARDEINFEYHF